MRFIFTALALAAVAMASVAAPRPIKECSGPECSASRYSTVYGLPSTSTTTAPSETPDTIIYNGVKYHRETPTASAPAKEIKTVSHHEEAPATVPAFGFCSASRESRGICGSSGARRGLIRGFFSRLFGGCGG